MTGENSSNGIVSGHKVIDLGRYRLIAELARGGMGIVYLALVRGPGGFNKLFVVKELKAHLVEDPNIISMFLEEARLAAKLSHPNVVQTIEVGSEGSHHFIAMEFLDGQSLNRVLTRSRTSPTPLPLHYQLHVLTGLLEGLQYAHGVTDFDGSPLGLVHRDVSPHNVFITYDGQVKVLDFGIAKALDSSGDTRTGVLKGKVAYMAPEQATGQPIDRRADVFSAGVMLWESAVGQRMWSRASNDLQILHSLMQGSIPRPREARPDIDAALERMILKATAPKRDDRYASAAEMQADLDAYVKALPLPPFGPRDVGKFVNDMFAAERGRIKAIVDDQIRVIRSLTSTGEIAAVDMPFLTTSTSTNPTSQSHVLFVAPQSASEPPRRDSARMALGEPRTVGETLTAVEGRRSLSAEAVPSAPPRSASRKGPWVAALAVIGVGAAAFVALRPQLEGPSIAPALAVTAATSGAPAAAAPANAPAARMHAAITASPRDARITIDDGAPQTGTLEATFARDGSQHAIKVDAPKFQSKIVVFTAEADHTFDIALEPSSAATPMRAARQTPHAAAPQPAPPPAATPPAPPPTASAPPPAAPTATGRPKQQIETRDPYAQ